MGIALAALLAGSACKKKDEARPVAPAPAPAEVTAREAHGRSAQALEAAVKAQEEAREEADDVVEAREEVTEQQRALEEARAELAREREEAERAHAAAEITTSNAELTAAAGEHAPPEGAEPEAEIRAEPPSELPPETQAGTQAETQPVAGRETAPAPGETVEAPLEIDPGAATPPAHDEGEYQLVTGRVVTSSVDRVVLSRSDQPVVEVLIGPHTTILANGLEATARDLVPGAEVAAHIRMVSDQPVAERLEVSKPEPPRAPSPAPE
jgi:hypothetical protein